MPETVSYRAISILSSKTMWFNLITLVLSILSMTEFQNVLPKETVAVITGTVLPVGNMILRLYSVRPVALFDQAEGSFLKKGESTPVEVKKL